MFFFEFASDALRLGCFKFNWAWTQSFLTELNGIRPKNKVSNLNSFRLETLFSEFDVFIV
jgi:hypothetical protein